MGSSNSEESPKERRDPAKGLLAYRSTPLACKFSPAQLLMGRHISNSVPMFHTQLDPRWPDFDNLQANEALRKLRQERVFHNQQKVKLLPALGQGTEVFMKDLQHSGRTVKAASTPRSYQIETPTSTIRRNHVHLTPMPEQPHPQQQRVEPSCETIENNAKNSAVTPMQSDFTKAPPTTPTLATRPQQIIKPFLNVRENQG